MRPRIINVLDIRGARLIRLDHNRRRHVHTFHPAQFGRRYNMPHPAGRPIANSAIVTHPNYHLGPDAVRSCWPGGRWDIERRIACGLVDAQATSRHIERSEEHTSELQSRGHLVCRLLLEKTKNINK